MIDLNGDSLAAWILIAACTGVAIYTIVSPVIRLKTHKAILAPKIITIERICDKIHYDVDLFDEDESIDPNRQEELTIFFKEKVGTIRTLRSDISNSLVHVPNTWPIPNRHYASKVRTMLGDLDNLLEICDNPTIPLKYQSAIWVRERDKIRNLTKNIVLTVADTL